MTRPTISDVARAAGVTKATVSHAYSGNRPISDATKARVFTAEAEGKAQVAEAKAAADAKIEKARGDAESIRVRNAAVVQNPGYQSEWVRKWDGQLPKVVYCSSENPCVTVPQQ